MRSRHIKELQVGDQWPQARVDLRLATGASVTVEALASFDAPNGQVGVALAGEGAFSFDPNDPVSVGEFALWLVRQIPEAIEPLDLVISSATGSVELTIELTAEEVALTPEI